MRKHKSLPHDRGRSSALVVAEIARELDTERGLTFTNWLASYKSSLCRRRARRRRGRDCARAADPAPDKRLTYGDLELVAPKDKLAPQRRKCPRVKIESGDSEARFRIGRLFLDRDGTAPGIQRDDTEVARIGDLIAEHRRALVLVAIDVSSAYAARPAPKKMLSPRISATLWPRRSSAATRNPSTIPAGRS